jgi:hypothetical protein
MAYTSYNDLKASVANYLGRSDLTTIIPDFISFAELRLSRDLRTRQMLNSAYALTTSGDPKISLPRDFAQIRDLYIQGTPRVPLTYMSPSSFTRNARADESGKPVFYTILASEFVLAPIPDTAYTMEILYYIKPQVLSSTNPSNAFLANYPDALLYATLMEAEPYLINDARTATWANLYDRAIGNISDADQGSEYAGVPIQMTVTSR